MNYDFGKITPIAWQIDYPKIYTEKKSLVIHLKGELRLHGWSHYSSDNHLQTTKRQ